MVFLTVLLKLSHWLLSYSSYPQTTTTTKLSNLLLQQNNNPNPKNKSSSSPFSSFPSITKFNHSASNRSSQTSVSDIQTLLRSPEFFPYFMLIAFEAGSLFRSFVLLLSYPFLYFFDYDLKLRVMIFITFTGLSKKNVESVSRTVLPKFYLDNVNLLVYEVLSSTGKRVVFTSVPKVIVEGFLKEYMKVDEVVGTELGSLGDELYNGFVSSEGLVVKHRAVKGYFGDLNKDDVVGVGGSGFHDHLFISQCKEAYVVNKEDGKKSAKTVMTRDKYPKPLVFHDGRLAFLPTPFATLSMFLWLPIGIILAIFRLVIGIYLPYKIAIFIGCLTGVEIKVKGHYPNSDSKNNQKSGVLFVCTHRTLLDPVFLSTSLAKSLTAVTYSLSKMSEIMAPIKTVRLTRDRTVDGQTMQKLLSEGDLVVCPEGTTCREPYLLRFSSLFAELADEIVPVAMNTHVTMFYGTTASGLKCLDPIFFLMNPRPKYHINILGKMPKEMTCAGGRSSHEVANYIQRQLGDALGFECTNLTRKDKYLMLAGNEGVVQNNKPQK